MEQLFFQHVTKQKNSYRSRLVKQKLKIKSDSTTVGSRLCRETRDPTRYEIKIGPIKLKNTNELQRNLNVKMTSDLAKILQQEGCEYLG